MSKLKVIFCEQGVLSLQLDVSETTVFFCDDALYKLAFTLHLHYETNYILLKANKLSCDKGRHVTSINCRAVKLFH